MRRQENVIFGSVQAPGAEKLDVYNAQVFNVSEKEENDLYLDVVRKYGPGQLESLIKPPETFFSSKDSALFVWVEWMGEATFKEEFLGEASPTDKDLERFQQETDNVVPLPWAEKSLVSLSERLSSVMETPENPQEGTTDDPTDE